MEKIKSKEIRITFKLSNENDRKLYEKLSEFTQPGKIIKKILSEHIYDDLKLNKQNDSNTDNFSNELILALNKLSDKIDNLNIVQIKEEPSETNKANDMKEISFTADVSDCEIDDLDF